ncbi:MAG: hypothetical protein A2381_16025 [Bdellovibrionales bacterium RIFOXYB1_FULL_37_110]|nr:MAG: hypothetical protein A2417_07875 [Bdellovibrionales bacterium RIFOXYC1_FULL_37_79]OFZ57121.1 MAG: hypothetical protein A2381_16025 [Bdellovibrionales bacterium RIFOXYB1_FULL_37_110]OFZ65395.1 MAG: hypothetical protein A2577_03845 [Bdellovibrionales bacterium RIFOXYD1_FULL_36_51]OFZ66019.1 MAG: hypothetical protein A2328_07255 [Bdellovibrionales bacterium RIFOXYB2_FULL_36_6]
MKNLIMFFCTFGMLSFTIWGREITKSYKIGSYEDAKKSSEYIKFEMDSTKLGIITTSFNGFVRDFAVSLNKEGNVVKDLKVAFEVKNMDTDIDARNEKMWNQCLDYKNFSNILVHFKSEIPLDNNDLVAIPVTMKIRGMEKIFFVNIKTHKEKNKVVLQGNANVKLSELGIPDPSIFVASVSDLVKISFYFSE